MIKAMFTSATGMKAQQQIVDSTANNLANVNTTGFKRNQVEFQDLIYVTQRAAGAEPAQGIQSPSSIQFGSGVRLAATTKVFSQGVLENTARELDVAIEGDGFLEVTTPGTSESRYTRDGALQINASGNVVTSDGYSIVPPITLPADTLHVSIGIDGTVMATTAGQPNTPTTLGNIQLARFANPAGLHAEGGNLFVATPASGPAQQGQPGTNGLGKLRQSFLERSNVEVVTELVNLILAQRAYEINSRAIRASDEMLSTGNNLTR
jgi:flagellar basal-body rod protein FlgG